MKDILDRILEITLIVLATLALGCAGTVAVIGYKYIKQLHKVAAASPAGEGSQK